MMAGSMKITLSRVSGAKFEATNPSGNKIVLDGPADLGGVNDGMRPMETLLSALAGCSAMDVLHIMGKQRQPLEGLEVAVEGERADAVPAVFTRIHLVFTGSGAIDPAKLQKAVELSMEKYCSVSRMLAPTVAITAESRTA